VDVGGCDYAAPLIAIARRNFPAGDFIVADAANVSTEPKYDIVLANSVFQYFPDFGYARRVLERMIGKTISAVAILDIPYAGTREEAERVRRDQLTKERYEKKYEGLEHRYYAPQWFGEIAEKYECGCEHFDQLVPNCTQSRMRFNVLIRKVSR
jgi:trans-aconitate methyltransferase